MSLRILIIDNDQEMVDNLKSILTLAQYEVIAADSGKVGIDMALSDKPDLILCEIVMPGLDGFGVLHILHSNIATEDIPFVFLTGRTDRNDFRLAMSLGADDYITKPFDGVELLRVIEMRVKRHQQLRAKYGSSPAEVTALINKAREVTNLNKLSENRQTRTYKRRDILFMEGQSPNELYHIEKGRVKVYKMNYDGKELITAIHEEGDFIGFLPLLENLPYNENAEAMEEVRISIIPKTDFLTLLYSNKDVASKFIAMLSRSYKEIEDRLIEIAYQSVRQRVASELLKLDDIGRSHNRLVITIPRREISNIVGTATESLNRTLSDFKDENLIDILDSGLRVLDRMKLEKVCHR